MQSPKEYLFYLLHFMEFLQDTPLYTEYLFGAHLYDLLQATPNVYLKLIKILYMPNLINLLKKPEHPFVTKLNSSWTK